MPGIHLTIGFSEEKFNSALEKLLHFKNYTKRIIHKNNELIIGFTGYENYPLKVFNIDGVKIILEGKIYSIKEKELKKELKKIIEKHEKNLIESFIKKTDGDFIIYMIFNNKIFIFNDYLGRLPFYLKVNGENIIISRELGFINNIIDKKFELDINSLSFYFLLGFPIKNKTLFKGIKRIPYCSLIKIEKNSVNIKTFSEYSFDEIENFGKREKKILKEYFKNGCKLRYEPSRENLLGLSGGLDSRTVGAALREYNFDFKSVICLFENRNNSYDVEIAKKVAEYFNSKYFVFVCGVREEYNDILLNIKWGLNNIAFSYSIDFFLKLWEKLGYNTNYFTGLGGPVLTPGFFPYKKLKNITELYTYITKKHGNFSPSFIARILGIKEEDMKEELIERLKEFPEKDPNLKYPHFLIYERDFKLVFEGEDRNRFFLWQNAPFYSLDFLKKVIKIPPEKRKNYSLYREFLKSFSPEITKIIYANVKLPLDSFRFKVIRHVFSKIYSLLPALHKKLREGGTLKKEEIKEIENLIKNSDILKNNKNMILEHIKKENIFIIKNILYLEKFIKRTLKPEGIQKTSAK